MRLTTDPSLFSEDCIQSHRPHTLLSDACLRQPTLTYRYDDNGVVVAVPNVWFNQTAAMRIKHMRIMAEQRREQASLLAQHPPSGWAIERVTKEIIHNRELAQKFEEEAQRLERAAKPGFPALHDHANI